MAENYIVSARKYRPDSWETVVGQSSITSTLQNAINKEQLAQAYLFCGPRGVGKTTCARIFAKTINETTSTEPDQDFSFNIFELDAASNNSVEDIRSITDQVRIPPQVGKYKVYIIDEVHMLSQAAFNAFLKTLEEPPPHAIFILATTEKHKIIPTILSRCQIFDFNRITVADMAKHLKSIAEKEGIEAEDEALHVIAEKADGALRDALSIFDQVVAFSGKQLAYDKVVENLNILDHDYYFKMTDLCAQEDITECLNLLNEIVKKGFDPHQFVTGFGNHIRNVLVAKDPATVSLLESSDTVKQRYIEQARDASLRNLVLALDLLNTADIQYRSSKNPRLLVELTLIQICSIAYNQAEKKNFKRSLKPFAGRKVNRPSVKANKPASLAGHFGKPQRPEASQPIADPAVLSKVAAIPSIKYGVQTKKTSVEEELEEEVVTGTRDAAFTANQVLEAWKEFFTTNTGGSLLAIAKETPEVGQNAEGTPMIQVTLANELLVANMKSILGDLKAHFRSRLKNDIFLFEYNVAKGPRTEMMELATPTTIYREMVKKNPMLDELKRQFKLRVE